MNAGPPTARALRTAVAAALLAAAALPAAGTAAAMPARQAPGEWTCTTTTSASAEPREVALGDVVRVALTVHTSCLIYDSPGRFVLVIDATAPMAGEPLEAAKRAARAVVDGLALAEPRARWLRIGVVAVRQTAVLACPLSSDPAALHACIDAVEAAGTAPLRDGLDVAARAIRAHPEDLGPPEDIRDVVVLLSDGPPTDGCGDLASASHDTQVAFGVLIATACATEGCQAECLQTASSSPRFFFTNPDALASTMRQVVFKRCGLAATDAVRPQCGVRPLPEVDVHLAAGMTHLPGSAEPPLSSHDPDFRALVWETPLQYGRTLTITYAVRARTLGDQLVNASASGIWHYDPWNGASFDWQYPELRVQVIAPPPWPADRLFLPAVVARWVVPER